MRRLRLWGRNALIASLAFHLLGAVGSAFLIAMRMRNKPQAVFESEVPPRPRLEPRKLEMKVRVQNLQKRSARPKLQPRLLAQRPSDIALPEIKKNPKTNRKIKRMASAVGRSGVGSGIGGGSGDGFGGGTGGFLPVILRARCNPSDRMMRLMSSGGTAACDAAVMNSLRWLRTQQNPDGSWGHAHPVGITGLTLLAYLGHCETPDSPEFGHAVQKGIDYLLTKARSGKGRMVGNSYEHGIATYALAEALSLTGDLKIETAVYKAVEVIIRGQLGNGGWDYSYKRAAMDISVTGWQVQALKAAHVAGVPVPGLESALNKAMGGLKSTGNAEGHWRYRTNSGRYTVSLTGAGVFGLQMWKNGGDINVRRGIAAIIRDGMKARYKKKGSPSLYAWYYNTLATFQHGGAEWSKWNTFFRSQLLEAQERDGSYKAESGGMTDRHGHGDGPIYRTCLCTLMLEVYYRYLPSSG